MKLNWKGKIIKDFLFQIMHGLEFGIFQKCFCRQYSRRWKTIEDVTCIAFLSFRKLEQNGVILVLKLTKIFNICVRQWFFCFSQFSFHSLYSLVCNFQLFGTNYQFFPNSFPKLYLKVNSICIDFPINTHLFSSKSLPAVCMLLVRNDKQ